MSERRYLLFDAGCGVCTSLAQEIEREAVGWLTARSLRDVDMQDLLVRAKRDWKWEPTLLEVKGGTVRAYTGLELRLRLIVGLGLKRAWRVTQVVHRAIIPDRASERRDFLRRGVVFSSALAAWLYLGWSSPLNRVLAGGSGGSGLARPRNDSEKKAKEWRANLRIRRSEEIEKARLKEAASRFLNASDTKELELLFRDKGFKVEEAEVQGVVHTMEDGNKLLAISMALDGYTAVHYEFAKNFGDYRSGTYLYSTDGKTVTLLGASVNGKRLSISGNESEITPATISGCEGCIDIWSGPWAWTGADCLQWDYVCLINCCGPCSLACGNAWTCLACVFLWCPFCATVNSCCKSAQENCHVCASP